MPIDCGEPLQPMVAFPSTVDDTPRGSGSLTERCVASARDRYLMENASFPLAAAPMRQRSAHEWATTPPFPTPALTASSLSSSSIHGERSPVLGPPGAGPYSRRTFDIPCMTSLPPARSCDDASSQTFPPKIDVGCADQPFSAEPLSYSQYDAGVSSLCSSFNGLAMSDQQGRVSTRSLDMASQHIASLSESGQPTPLLIPMQPTGAGVPLTSVVETLSSKGSKAAAEDPETVAAAYKLSQWGIG